MALITSRLDLIIHRFRKWHLDNYADDIIVSRKDVATLLEGYDELRVLARAAPDSAHKALATCSKP